MLSIIRHEHIFNPREHTDHICIVGAGATGSRIFMALIELGLSNITVYDPDTVEAHNLANQAYLHKHIGLLKVEALRDLYRMKMGTSPPESMQFIPQTVPSTVYPLKGIVFLLTDTMSSRKEIFDTQLKKNPDVFHVYETRMAATHGRILHFCPNVTKQADAWEATLVPDGEAEVSPCGGTLSVGTTASIIANMAVWQFMHMQTNPDAADSCTKIFLRPTAITTGRI